MLDELEQLGYARIGSSPSRSAYHLRAFSTSEVARLGWTLWSLSIEPFSEPHPFRS